MPGEWAALERLSDELRALLDSSLAHVRTGSVMPPVDSTGVPAGAALGSLVARVEWLLAKGPLAQLPFERVPGFEQNRASVPVSLPSCERCGRLVKRKDERAHLWLTPECDAVWSRHVCLSLVPDRVVRAVHRRCVVGVLPDAFIVDGDDAQIHVAVPRGG